MTTTNGFQYLPNHDRQRGVRTQGILRSSDNSPKEVMKQGSR